MKRKAEFLTVLENGPLDDTGFALLTAKLVYFSAKAGQQFEALPGFRTNFVTGRKLLVVRRIVQDTMNPAAVIHDQLYDTGEVSRALADEVFLEAMLVLGVAGWRAYAAYAAVRAFGWKFYRAAPAIGVEKNPVRQIERQSELEQRSGASSNAM